MIHAWLETQVGSVVALATYMVSAVVLGTVSSRWGNERPRLVLIPVAFVVDTISTLIVTIPTLMDVSPSVVICTVRIRIDSLWVQCVMGVTIWLCVAVIANVGAKFDRWNSNVCRLGS